MIAAHPSLAQLPTLSLVDSIVTPVRKDYLPLRTYLHQCSLGSYFKYPQRAQVHLLYLSRMQLDSVGIFVAEKDRQLFSFRRSLTLAAPQWQAVNREANGLAYLQRSFYQVDSTTTLHEGKLKFTPPSPWLDKVGVNAAYGPAPRGDERVYWDEGEGLIFLANLGEDPSEEADPVARHLAGLSYLKRPLISRWLVGYDRSGSKVRKLKKQASMVSYPEAFAEGSYNYLSDYFFTLDYKHQRIWVSFAAFDTLWAYDYQGNKIDSIAAPVPGRRPHAIPISPDVQDRQQVKGEIFRRYEEQPYYASLWVEGDYLYRLCSLAAIDTVQAASGPLGAHKLLLQRIHLPNRAVKAWQVPLTLRPYGCSGGYILAQRRYDFEQFGYLTIYVLDDVD